MSMGMHRLHRRLPYPGSGRAQRGFGLVELMVAVVIALVASLAIFQTFAASEERKRTTTSGSEGLQSAMFAMSYMERMLSNAGYNMVAVSDPGYISTVRNINFGAGTFTLSSYTPPRTELDIGCTATVAGTATRIVPLTVASGGGALASDTLTLMAGSSATVPLPVRTNPLVVPIGSAVVTLDSTYGFAIGDWVLVYEENDASATMAGTLRTRACTLAQVTGLPNAPTISPAGIQLSVATAAAYDIGAVINLGPRPVMNQFTVDANQRLLMTDLMNPGAGAQVIADNVLAMKAQLGIDVGGDDVIDEWLNPPAAATTWLNPNNPLPALTISALPVVAGARALHQIKAVRLGLLVRSPQFERPNTAGACATTPAGPYQVLDPITGSAAQRTPDMPGSGSYTLAGNQQCFRYNTVNAIIPLRNPLLSDM